MDLRDFLRKVNSLQDLATRGKLYKTQAFRNPNIAREYRRKILNRSKQEWGVSDPAKVKKIENLLESFA